MNGKKFTLSERDERRLREFRLMDDDFMKIVFDNNPEATELLLNVFFDRDDMKVLSVVSQREIKNPNDRSVRLDIYAEDSEGRHYDIEIQRQDRGAGERRARFNSSMLDTRLLKSGQNPEELPDAYVIFITENDIRGQGYPIYRFRRMDERTHEWFDDGSHILYVNGAYHNENDRIGRLMHDFRCTDAGDMHNKVLADKVRYFKETEGGHEKMSKIMEEIVREKAIEIAVSMLKDNILTHELIAKYSGLTLEEIKELAEKQKN